MRGVASLREGLGGVRSGIFLVSCCHRECRESEQRTKCELDHLDLTRAFVDGFALCHISALGLSVAESCARVRICI